MKKFLLFLLFFSSLPSFAELSEAYKQYWERQYDQCTTKQCVQEVYNRAALENIQQQRMIDCEIPQIIERPTEQKIEYGYDAYGDFVPKAIGGQKIKYGYNSFGEYVPVSISE